MNHTELNVCRTLVRCIRVAFRVIPPYAVIARRDTARNMLEVFCEQMGMQKDEVVVWALELDDGAFGYWGEIKDEVMPAFKSAFPP